MPVFPKELKERAWDLWQASRSPLPPHWSEILYEDEVWLSEMLWYDKGMQFNIDYTKRPPDLR